MTQDPRVLLQKADKAAAGAGSGFSFFGGRAEKWEGACELYIQAANAFRVQGQMTEGGRILEKAADIQLDKLNEPEDHANTLTEAYKAYRKTDPEDAARVIAKAISHYTGKGNFRRAATQQQNLAELFEVELGDDKRAAEAYETAAQWFSADNAEALANKLWLKVADLSAITSDYYKAIQLYEQVSRSSINNNLMKWSVKEYLLKAGICHLATGDLIGVAKALENYREMDTTFITTREHQLLVDLADACEKQDQELFSDKLLFFDQLSKLDKWKTTILLRVKNSIEEQGDDFS